jgi:cell division protein FtsB
MNPSYPASPGFTFGSQPLYNPHEYGAEAERIRLLTEKRAAEDKLRLSLEELQNHNAIARQAVAENDAMKRNALELEAGKRKLEDQLRGTLAENARLMAEGRAMEAKRTRFEEDTLRSAMENKRQADEIKQLQHELSNVRTKAQSLALRNNQLVESLNYAKVHSRGLSMELVNIKVKGETDKAKEKTDKAKEKAEVDTAKQFQELKTKYENVTKTFTEAKAKYDEQTNGHISTLKARNNTLVEEKNGLKAKNDALVEENTGLKAQVSELEEAVKRKTRILDEIVKLARKELKK